MSESEWELHEVKEDQTRHACDCNGHLSEWKLKTCKFLDIAGILSQLGQGPKLQDGWQMWNDCVAYTNLEYF